MPGAVSLTSPLLTALLCPVCSVAYTHSFDEFSTLDKKFPTLSDLYCYICRAGVCKYVVLCMPLSFRYEYLM